MERTATWTENAIIATNKLKSQNQNSAQNSKQALAHSEDKEKNREDANFHTNYKTPKVSKPKPIQFYSIASTHSSSAELLDHHPTYM